MRGEQFCHKERDARLKLAAELKPEAQASAMKEFYISAISEGRSQRLKTRSATSSVMRRIFAAYSVLRSAGDSADAARSCRRETGFGEVHH